MSEEAAHDAAGVDASLTTDADVYNLYALSLGRHPESPEVMRGMVGHDRAMLVRTFFATDEHATNVLEPLETGRRLTGGLLDQAPGEDLLAWAAQALPLTAESRAALETAAASWHLTYEVLFADPLWASQIEAGLAARRRGVLGALAAFARVEGRIERRTVEGLSGWVVAPGGADAPLTVEARVDGRVVALASSSTFRRDVQDRFGGAGLCGFQLVLDDRLLASARAVSVEVHEARTGIRIDGVTLSAQSAPLTAHAALLAELAGVRQILGRIEAALPAIQADLAFDLDAYGDWRETYHRRPKPGAATVAIPGGSQPVVVVLDARGVPAPWLDDSLDSLVGQTEPNWTALLIGEGAMIEDLARRTEWRSGREVRVVAHEAAAELGSPSDTPCVVRLDARGVLAPDALAVIRSALGDGDAAYWDEDVMEEGAQAPQGHAARRRRMPQLKPAFDLDLLRQDPYLGSGIALTPQALATLGEGVWSPETPSQTALRLAERERPVRHLAHVLYSRQRPAEVDPVGWASAVQAHFDRLGIPADVRVTDDPLGAGAAVRVEPDDTLGGLRAAVIIPTKDRVDLLRPCLESLFEAESANSVAMDVLVVDHESRDAETVAYLQALAAEGRIRVLPYVGAFNWALMNNLAAVETDADILVFLNNDTAVVSPDWLDRLCRQAARPDVGAAGARLIFPDGAIQHAGFVSRPLPDSFLMPEGVGAPGSDGGYLGRHARLRRTAAVTGACMAVRNELFRRLGGFDAANLPIDWNDVEFCLKARAEGLDVIYEPAAILYHYESRSRGLTRDGDRIVASSRSAALVWERWGEMFGTDPDYNAHFDRPGTPFSRLAPPPPLSPLCLNGESLAAEFPPGASGGS